MLTYPYKISITLTFLLINFALGQDVSINSKKSSAFLRKFVTVDQYKMAYHESGEGDIVLFFHGNPTSSYEWRKIIPHLNKEYKCIAFDMIGMGNSEKVPVSVSDRYSYDFHFKKIQSFIEKVVPKQAKLYIVGHDWGGVLAIHWARLNPDRVNGIAFMETFLEPLETGKSPSFAIEWFRNWRTTEMGKAVLDSNRFVEKVLLADVGPYLTEDDIAEYRRAYINQGDDRMATLAWPRQVSIDKEPFNTHQILVDNIQFMRTTAIKKLFVNAEPGAMLAAPARRAEIRSWPNLTEVTVKGRHFIQEVSPNEIGQFLYRWIKENAHTMQSK